MPNIKLKDGSGIEQTYTGIDTITVPLADGTGSYVFGVTDEELTFSDNCSYLFSNNKVTSFYIKFKDRITTNNITNFNSMFSNWNEDVPFAINYNNNTSSPIQITYFPCNGGNGGPSGFSGGINFSAPNITYISDFQCMFNNSYNLRNFPTITGLIPLLQKTGGNTAFANCFSGCYSLRSIPSELLKECYNKGNSTGWNYHIYYSFSNNYALDKVEGMPVYRAAALTSNIFNNCGNCCARLSDFIFDTNNGTPYSVNWKNQTLNLSNYTGYVQDESHIFDYNSGITSAKRVTDAASYAALKDDPDWWTTDVLYSRYNHTSAVNTINSLPDCSSSGGTNTIKFKGTSGTNTDGGPISNLTAAEIQVATDKGWTVTIV